MQEKHNICIMGRNKGITLTQKEIAEELEKLYNVVRLQERIITQEQILALIQKIRSSYERKS